MTELLEPKSALHRYLQVDREALLWKLEGLSERDLRMPRTPTGTNLIGIVKHMAHVELGYFGDTFDRPSGIDLPWYNDDAELNEDMWLTRDESREWVIDLYHQAWGHAADTFAACELDTIGHVAHWDGEQVSLHQMLVHVATETHHHAGHADILREMVDGAAGFLTTASNLPGDGYDWAVHVARVEAAAATFR